jgi:hypothetical protein
MREQAMVDGELEFVPRTLTEAHSPEFYPKWKDAIHEEIHGNLIANKCFSPQIYTKATLPADALVVKMKFVGKIKTGENNKLIKRKARITGTGYHQEYGYHYKQTYSPTCAPESLRLILYKFHCLNWTPFQFDIAKAFIMAPLDRENIFIKIEPGFPDYVSNLIQFYQLLKAIYGLKQAAALWNQLFLRTAFELGYKATKTDPCYFYYINPRGLQTDFVLWVDDIVGASMDPNEADRIAHTFLAHGWDYTRSNKLEKILGMYIGRSISGNLVVYNSTYIFDVLRELNLSKIKHRSTPAQPNVYFVPNNQQLASPELHKKFRKGMGSTAWIVRFWRPDASWPQAKLSHFLHNPSTEHFEALLWMLGYLAATARCGIYFKISEPISSHFPHYIVSCDANWAGDYNGKSTSSYIIMAQSPECIRNAIISGIWPSGNFISWSSKTQSVTHTSSEGAESQCVVEATKELLALRNQSQEIKMPILVPSPTLIDNSATIVNCHEHKTSRRNRHQAVQLGFLQDNHGTTFEAHKIKSADNIADIGSKPVTVAVFNYLVGQLIDKAV